MLALEPKDGIEEGVGFIPVFSVACINMSNNLLIDKSDISLSSFLSLGRVTLLVVNFVNVIQFTP